MATCMHSSVQSPHGRSANYPLGLIVVAYPAARFLEVIPNHLPQTAIVALDVLSALAFAIVHGAWQYGWRGIAAFIAICLVLGNLSENLSIATGFPFGHYYFAGLMGVKIFNVPILFGLADIGIAYVAWTVARLIAGDAGSPVSRTGVFALPLIASFIMVAWDLAQDPVWAT